jgi:hypothetical protein
MNSPPYEEYEFPESSNTLRPRKQERFPDASPTLLPEHPERVRQTSLRLIHMTTHVEAPTGDSFNGLPSSPSFTMRTLPYLSLHEIEHDMASLDCTALEAVGNTLESISLINVQSDHHQKESAQTESTSERPLPTDPKDNISQMETDQPAKLEPAPTLQVLTKLPDADKRTISDFAAAAGYSSIFPLGGIPSVRSWWRTAALGLSSNPPKALPTSTMEELFPNTEQDTPEDYQLKWEILYDGIALRDPWNRTNIAIIGSLESIKASRLKKGLSVKIGERILYTGVYRKGVGVRLCEIRTGNGDSIDFDDVGILTPKILLLDCSLPSLELHALEIDLRDILISHQPGCEHNARLQKAYQKTRKKNMRHKSTSEWAAKLEGLFEKSA